MKNNYPPPPPPQQDEPIKLGSSFGYGMVIVAGSFLFLMAWAGFFFWITKP